MAYNVMQYVLRFTTLVALWLTASMPFATGTLAAQPSQNVTNLTIGTSVQGRPILAFRIGDGPRKLVLVSNTHGGPEANTYQLALQLLDYYRTRPELVPTDVRLYIIPTLNPDGLALDSRFNANGVDLNRNLNTNLDACPENDWRQRVQGAYGVVSDTGGPYPDSEVEARLIRSFLLDASGAIFFHSNAGLVFPALCEHPPSIAMSETFAKASSYTYSRFWPLYQITGGMHDWAASLGVASITPELMSGELPEFEQNLAGVQAVLNQATELLPLPEDHVEAGIPVPALIWRYWRMHGGALRFGMPLEPPQTEGNVVRQYFERTMFEWHPELADTSQLVQTVPLGRTLTEGQTFPPDSPGEGRFFPETQQRLFGAFLDYWERGGGLALFGLPISAELTEIGPDGHVRTVQYFERARFEYDPVGFADGTFVRLGPLGWQSWHRSHVGDATSAAQPR